MSNALKSSRHLPLLPFDEHSEMCKDEVVGDWYRGCSHFVKIYETGERLDCEDQFCALSREHVHTAINCPCPKEPEERRKIQNMFHTPCDECRNAEFARLVGR